MHVLDPVYPQLPVDFDWGALPQGFEDHSCQSASSIGASDAFQWDPTSQMPSTPYPQSGQRQTYADATNQPQWYGQLFSDFTADRKNSTQVPLSSFADDWSSQPPPRIRGHSVHADADTQLMDIRWAEPGPPHIGGSAEMNRCGRLFIQNFFCVL
jgi:hypothetical protein